MGKTSTKVKKLNKAEKEKAEKLKAQQEMFRHSPDKLAAFIAKRIRADKKKGLDATQIEPNGKMHWYQKQWGQVRFKQLNLDNPIEIDRDLTVYPAHCATTGCVAGHATTAAGYPMLVSKWDIPLGMENDPDFVFTTEKCLLPGNVRVDIQSEAQKLLRLDADQRSYLFGGERGEEQVLHVLDMIAAGNYDWTPYVDTLPSREDDDY